MHQDYLKSVNNKRDQKMNKPRLNECIQDWVEEVPVQLGRDDDDDDEDYDFDEDEEERDEDWEEDDEEEF